MANGFEMKKWATGNNVALDYCNFAVGTLIFWPEKGNEEQCTQTHTQDSNLLITIK